VAEECGAASAVRFDPNARAFEAFACSDDGDTRLLDPLAATSLKDALAETTSRWAWDRGSRVAVREIGERVDLLHVYAVRRSATGGRVWRGHVPSTEYSRWLDHICTIDLHVIAGVNLKAVGCEIDIHNHRQAQRPEGAVL
jgi:hypothetical protein